MKQNKSRKTQNRKTQNKNRKKQNKSRKKQHSFIKTKKRIRKGGMFNLFKKKKKCSE